MYGWMAVAEIGVFAFLLLVRTPEQHEEERVIKHNQVSGEQSFARLLEKAVGILSAGFPGADVGFAANLRPNFRVGFHGKIAERTVFRGARPIDDASELRLLRGGEEFGGLLQRALQPPWAKIILAAFHEGGLELDGQHFFQDRDIFVKKLLLQIDRVRRDDCFLLLLERVENGGREISERLANARAGFDYEMSLLFKGVRHGRGHRLLLGAIFEIFRFREQAALGKDRANVFDKFSAKRIFQRDHRN